MQPNERSDEPAEGAGGTTDRQSSLSTMSLAMRDGEEEGVDNREPPDYLKRVSHRVILPGSAARRTTSKPLCVKSSFGYGVLAALNQAPRSWRSGRGD
jgi:hypothetical protein